MIAVVDLLALARSGERDAAFHGLVTLASPAALNALVLAHETASTPVRREWIAEAIEQVVELLTPR